MPELDYDPSSETWREIVDNNNQRLEESIARLESKHRYTYPGTAPTAEDPWAVADATTGSERGSLDNWHCTDTGEWLAHPHCEYCVYEPPLVPTMKVDNINLPRVLLGSADEKLRKFGWTVTSTGCWEWNGGRTVHRGGYGQVKYAGEVLKAHRLAYETWVGPLEAGQFVCHHCDNPPCINPDHLFAGTPADNNWDKVRKGRARGGSLPGELHPNAILTEAAVVEIRRRLNAGDTGKQIASDYGVTPATISRIKKRQTWRHV